MIVSVSAEAVIFVGVALLVIAGVVLLVVGHGRERREAAVPFGLALTAVVLMAFVG